MKTASGEPFAIHMERIVGVRSISGSMGSGQCDLMLTSGEGIRVAEGYEAVLAALTGGPAKRGGL